MHPFIGFSVAISPLLTVAGRRLAIIKSSGNDVHLTMLFGHASHWLAGARSVEQLIIMNHYQ
jgi:hypothetical protein